jgi:hypothetical protein
VIFLPMVSADTPSLPNHLVTDISSALRLDLSAGDGSIAIFPSMLPKSRRFRWLSASSNQ